MIHHATAGAGGTLAAWAGTAALAVTTVLATLDTTAVTVAAIGTAGTIATGLLVYLQARAGRRADDARNKADATNRLVDQLQEQLKTEVARAAEDRAAWTTRQADLERRVTEVNLGVARLIGQLQAHGIEPVWHPTA